MRFSGEPLAAVAAPDEATLVAALAAITVDVEALPFVTDLEEAAAGAHPVHADLQPYAATFPVPQEGNICARTVTQAGDVDAAFAAAEHIVEGRYATPRVHQGYIEPRACVATAEPDGGYTVRTSTQNPFGVRATLAKILAVPEPAVRVIGATVGGGFGGKLDVTFEHWACLLARKSGRPVKFVSSRAEELPAANPREDSVVHIRSAIGADGALLAREVRCLLNAGAYAHDTPFLAAVATIQATGPYRIHNVRADGVSRLHQHPAHRRLPRPVGAPDGPRRRVAHGRDRRAPRRRPRRVPPPAPLRRGRPRLQRPDRPRPLGPSCLDRAVEAIGYGRDLPPGHGIGIACAWWTTTYGPTGATVRVETDGSVSVVTGATEIGSGAVASGLVHLTAEAFGIAPEQVRLASTADTGTGVYDFGAQGSRTTFNVGNAMLLARRERPGAAAPGGRRPARGRARRPRARGRLRPRRRLAGASRGPGRDRVLRAVPRWADPRLGALPRAADPVRPRLRRPAALLPDLQLAELPLPCRRGRRRRGHRAGRGRPLRGRPGRGPRDRPAGDRGPDPGRGAPGDRHGPLRGGAPRGRPRRQRHARGLQAPDRRGVAPQSRCLIVERPSAVGPDGAKGVGEPPIIVPAAALVNAVSAATGRRFPSCR